MTEITLEVETPPAVEIDVGPPSPVEISVSPTSVDLEVTPPSPIEIYLSPPPVIEVSADRASTITLEVVPPPIVEFNVGVGVGGAAAPVIDEVWIGETKPTDPAVELWVNLLEDPPGGGGGGTGEASFYEHSQAMLSKDWVVVHNLGRRPSVSTRDAVENVMYGSVHHDSIAQLTVHFTTSCTGKAYCT